jgi:hypothetical protein
MKREKKELPIAKQIMTALGPWNQKKISWNKNVDMKEQNISRCITNYDYKRNTIYRSKIMEQILVHVEQTSDTKEQSITYRGTNY